MNGTEIWKTITVKGGERYWTFRPAICRAVPVKRADAELGLIEGPHSLIAKPDFVGS